MAETKSEVDTTFEDYHCTETEFLHRAGVLGRKTALAHCVWLSGDEMDMLAKTGSSVVHNPICNMYLGSGIAAVPALLRKGVNVDLGSDGGTCGSSHDMFGVMKAAALLHKVSTLDPKAITAHQVLKMATVGGARAVGMESTLGSIEVGKSADVFLLDLRKLYSAPIGDLISNIVFYASPANVDSVLVNGNLVVEKGEVLTIDEERLVENSQRRSDEIESRVREHF
jgi:5-methylthioadenosine/S-adenosylhomocysteine deaminase